MHLRLSITLSTALAFTALSAQSPLKHSFLTSPPNQPSQPFQDPHGQYTLSVPAGWEAVLSGEEPSFHNGPSWVQVRVIKADSPSDAIDLAANLFRPQFTAFNTINRGNTTIANRPSHGLNVDAVTTNGQRVSVLLTAQPHGKKQFFVLVSATPVAQAPQLNSTVMALANSVRFAGE